MRMKEWNGQIRPIPRGAAYLSEDLVNAAMTRKYGPLQPRPSRAPVVAEDNRPPADKLLHELIRATEDNPHPDLIKLMQEKLVAIDSKDDHRALADIILAIALPVASQARGYEQASFGGDSWGMCLHSLAKLLSKVAESLQEI